MLQDAHANTCTNSNQVDLRLLEEMGITPDITIREKRHSLKTVGLMVVACVRVQKMQQAWAGNKKLHESLMKKLEGMRKKKQQLGRA
nr:hypothetical protein CFP56_52725 [Quercus suber]